MKLSKIGVAFFLGMTMWCSVAGAQSPTSAGSPAAAVPRLVNFSGKSTDAQGKAIAGIAGATFSIYKGQSEGSPMWMETQNIHADAKGNFTVQLGASSPQGLPIELFAGGEARWLGVRIDGGLEQPRTLLLSVPYALKAVDADTLGGKPLSAFLLATQAANPDAARSEGQTQKARPQASYPIKCASATACGKGFVPLFNTSGGAATVTDSIMQQSGTTVSIAGAVKATGAVIGGSFAIGANPFAFGSYSNQNVFLGFAGNTSTTAAGNTGVGPQALFANTTGTQNTASGGFALHSNTKGHDNTANGAGALYTNSTGAYNTANGSLALYHNTGGTNVATGYEALYTNDSGYSNLAEGYQAMYQNQSGYGNVAEGYQTLFGNTTGFSNTGVGANAGQTTTTGFFNTSLGYEAGPASGGLFNTTTVGAFASAAVNNALILGGTGTSATTVGIGTASPYFDYGLTVTTGGQNGNINGGVVVNATGGNLYLGMTNSVHKFRVDTNGVAYANGGFQSSGADFAESFTVRGKRSQYEPGDVLEIDQKADRNLALSRHPYATLVAGIYSTKPGLLASPHSIDDPVVRSSEVPLAVVGIVPCKVTAENGPIFRGDLLVTSSRAGYAMRGTDRRRMLGAVVGKALEPLPKGNGVIQVLVTLQ
jgi:hypothetical protein